MQSNLKAVLKFFDLLFVVTAQTFGQTAQGVFEVAVVVEVFNQETQSCTVGLAQTQSQGLAMQVCCQRFLAARQFGGVGHFIGRIVIFASRCVAAPFRVIGRELHTAVAFPTLGNAVNTRLGITRCVVDGDLRHATVKRRHLSQALSFCFVRDILFANGRIRFVDAEFFAWRFFKLFVEKRVLVEHLLDLLA